MTALVAAFNQEKALVGAFSVIVLTDKPICGTSSVCTLSMEYNNILSRCVATYSCHQEGVWALQTNETFSQVVSSGRDGCVYMTDLR